MTLAHQRTLYRHTLSTGVLTVIHTDGTPSPDTLFEIAERRNPKRAFLFVSKVLGRHIPVCPHVMRSVYRQLAEQIPDGLPEPVLFVGLAETAVGLGAGVFDELRHRFPESVYISSTRHPVEGTLLCEFKEAHSHATDHLIYLPDDAGMRRRVLDARTIVLVDDEATTGNTFHNLLAALRHEGELRLAENVVTVTLTDWSGEALAAGSPLPVNAVSLISGNWSWEPFADAPLPEMLNINVTARGTHPLSPRQSWGRKGMTQPAGDLGTHLVARPGEQILVLGTSEFVWEPFLLAERLEKQGASVKYSSTTRSPIAPGFAIKSALSFADNYGLGIPNFVYNVVHQSFDRIILCIETPPESVDTALLSALRAICPSVEVLHYE